MINEKLSVPSGLTETASMLYDFILNNIDSKINRQFTLEYIDRIFINKTPYYNITLNIMCYEYSYNKIEAAAIFSKSDLINKKQYYSNTNTITIDIVLYLIERDVKEFIKIKNDIISVISHEIKHAYDLKMIGYVLEKDIMDYEKYIDIYKNKPFKYEILNDILYYLYLSSKIEALVHNTEIASLIRELKIKKKEFKSFLSMLPKYQQFVKMKNLKIKDLNLTLLQIEEFEIETELNLNQIVKQINIKGDEILRKLVKLVDLCQLDSSNETFMFKTLNKKTTL